MEDRIGLPPLSFPNQYGELGQVSFRNTMKVSKRESDLGTEESQLRVARDQAQAVR
jgi:hypothetical protein